MTREEIEKLIPPISLEEVRAGLEKAKKFGESYEPKARYYYPEGYDNGTSEAVYQHLVEASNKKEALLAKRNNG